MSLKGVRRFTWMQILRLARYLGHGLSALGHAYHQGPGDHPFATHGVPDEGELPW